MKSRFSASFTLYKTHQATLIILLRSTKPIFTISHKQRKLNIIQNFSHRTNTANKYSKKKKQKKKKKQNGKRKLTKENKNQNSTLYLLVSPNPEPSFCTLFMSSS
jgi:hypothetical protein